MSDPLPSAIPAATVILWLDRLGAPPLHLMIERGAGMVFAPGAMVFPGGRVDPEDRAVAADKSRVRDPPPDPEDAAAMVAAIREAIEEVGVAIAIDPAPEPDAIFTWRAALAAGAPFGALLATAGATLDLALLIPFARWRPEIGNHSRRFDTRFYLARADVEHAVAVDGGEATRFRWLSARDALDDADAGRSSIIFPTRRNLERLATLADFDAAVAHSRAFPPRLITPWIEHRADGAFLCIPEDAGYPETSLPLDRAMRGLGEG